MTKVITFSRTFPKGHRREGEQTYFVEKVWNGLLEDGHQIASHIYNIGQKLGYAYADDAYGRVISSTAKYHTIRKGNRWKEGEYFSPRVWSGKPYNSKQITIAPDIKIVKIWQCEITAAGEFMVPKASSTDTTIVEIAINDGLSIWDFKSWFNDFKEPGEFQIICWSPQIVY